MDMNNYQMRAPIKKIEGLSLRALKEIKKGGKDYISAPVIVAIALHNQSDSVAMALDSALKQTLVVSKLARIVILDDQSEDDWMLVHEDLVNHDAITVLHACCGTPARARNLLLDYAENSNVKWVARLDSDDYLASEGSLEALWKAGEKQKANFVLGSNKLQQFGKLLTKTNVIKPELFKSKKALLEFINNFCFFQSGPELPSCNLLLRTDSGFRYPNVRSAEDHWLAAKLIMFHSEKGTFVTTPFYSVYSLDGKDSKQNQRSSVWYEQRKRLNIAASIWHEKLSLDKQIIGSGMEGIVFQEQENVIKEFFPWAIDKKAVNDLKNLLPDICKHLPKVKWSFNNDTWSYKTPYVSARPMAKKETKKAVITFLSCMYRKGICCLNIKRDNILVLPDGDFFDIDISKDIKSLTSSYFLDMSARLYSIAILGNDDEELVRRKINCAQDAALAELPGFMNFYAELIKLLHPAVEASKYMSKVTKNRAIDTTLLIKSCAQDADVLFEQVSHIVTQLSYPSQFASVVLLIDTYRGPFLREYQKGNYDVLCQEAKKLKELGVIDKILYSPSDIKQIRKTYLKWFAISNVINTHTTKSAPLFSQIWAFDQIETPYLLQCDCDVLIGRKDFTHNYLQQMRNEFRDNNVQCVGFNIPKSTNEFLPYFGEPGEFPPEVRLGLLNLANIKNHLPLDNPQHGEHFTLMWHRALQRQQEKLGIRSVRGGDPKTFYIHPQNSDKCCQKLPRIRDLISQGIYPDQQAEEFDLIQNAAWKYERRSEEIVFLLKGRYTEHNKLRRCIESLKMQSNQNFGVIVIDDESGCQHNWCYPLFLGNLNKRTTMIRRHKRVGRLPNFIEAIEDVCNNIDSLIVVLDQDDCLMHSAVVEQLIEKLNEGADLIQLPMFRPNKPVKLYRPNYIEPRKNGSGEVWAHLRAFKKSLFQRVPKQYFQLDGCWIDSVTDYLTMLPMAELAENPIFCDSAYAYYHQRENYTIEAKNKEFNLIKLIMRKASLQNTVAVAPMLKCTVL